MFVFDDNVSDETCRSRRELVSFDFVAVLYFFFIFLSYFASSAKRSARDKLFPYLDSLLTADDDLTRKLSAALTPRRLFVVEKFPCHF